jgi:hypothetical protein
VANLGNFKNLLVWIFLFMFGKKRIRIGIQVRMRIRITFLWNRTYILCSLLIIFFLCNVGLHVCGGESPSAAAGGRAGNAAGLHGQSSFPGKPETLIYFLDWKKFFFLPF